MNRENSCQVREKRGMVEIVAILSTRHATNRYSDCVVGPFLFTIFISFYPVPCT